MAQESTEGWLQLSRGRPQRGKGKPLMEWWAQTLRRQEAGARRHAGQWRHGVVCDVQDEGEAADVAAARGGSVAGDAGDDAAGVDGQRAPSHKPSAPMQGSSAAGCTTRRWHICISRGR